MALDPSVSSDITTQIDAIEAKLIAAAGSGSRGFGTPAPVLEAVEQISRVEGILRGVLTDDPVAWVAFTNRLQRVWAAYVQATDLSGLGAVAEIALGRSR